MCLLKIVLPKVANHVFYTMFDVFINWLSLRDSWHVWKFTMSYPFCVRRNDSITYKMWSYVIYRLASFIPTFNIGTEKFPAQRRCITFSKLQELFNPILIHLSNAWCFHPTPIHVSPLLWHLIKLSDMQKASLFFIKGVALSHSGRYFL